MFVKLGLFIYYFTGTYILAQINPSCRQIDFNDAASLDEFEQCEECDMFDIKPYADVPFQSFRSDVENHLSNVNIGCSCFRTKQIFNLDRYVWAKCRNHVIWLM